MQKIAKSRCLAFNKLDLTIFVSIICLLAAIFTSPALSNPMVWSGTRAMPKVALTFDDGPKPEQSTRILKILDKYGVRATFFVVGKEVKWYPDLVYQMHILGHDIANHSYQHIRLDTMTSEEIDRELSQTNDLIEKITGKRPNYFRPPGGRYNRLVLDSVARHNMRMIMWDVNAGDYTRTVPVLGSVEEERGSSGILYTRSSEVIARDVLKNVQNGSIILFHNGGDETIKALPEIIETLEKRGIKLVRVSELLGAPELTRLVRIPLE